MLHNVRSAHNVGSIFRTADAAGVTMIYLAGVTPAPRDRFGRVQKEIAKVALGAETSVVWEKHTSPGRVIATLRRGGWKVAAVEQDTHSKNYRNFKTGDRTLFIFGNEVRGLPSSVLKKCNAIIEIPMHGKKESLNVSVAAGIILFSAVSHSGVANRGIS